MLHINNKNVNLQLQLFFFNDFDDVSTQRTVNWTGDKPPIVIFLEAAFS